MPPLYVFNKTRTERKYIQERSIFRGHGRGLKLLSDLTFGETGDLIPASEVIWGRQKLKDLSKLHIIYLLILATHMLSGNDLCLVDLCDLRGCQLELMTDVCSFRSQKILEGSIFRGSGWREKSLKSYMRIFRIFINVSSSNFKEKSQKKVEVQCGKEFSTNFRAYVIFITA